MAGTSPKLRFVITIIIAIISIIIIIIILIIIIYIIIIITFIYCMLVSVVIFKLMNLNESQAWGNCTLISCPQLLLD